MQYILPLTTKNVFSKDIGLLKAPRKLNEAIFSEIKVKKKFVKYFSVYL